MTKTDDVSLIKQIMTDGPFKPKGMVYVLTLTPRDSKTSYMVRYDGALAIEIDNFDIRQRILFMLHEVGRLQKENGLC